MLALLLCIATLPDLAETGLTLASRVPLPVSSNSTYAIAAIPGSGRSDSIAFVVAVPGRSLSRELSSLRYDAKTGTIIELKGHVDRFQEDCGVGIASVQLFEGNSSETIDVATGMTLSKIDHPISRVGVLGIERLTGPSSRSSDVLRVYDLRSGEKLTTIARFTNGTPYIGRIAWDDGRLRMLAIAHKGSDGYDLYKTRGRSFDRGESVTLFEYAMGFDRIVGNPAIGPFAAQYSTNRRVFFITLTEDFKKTKAQVDDVHDVSQKGVLGRMIVKENDLADPDLGPIGCWDVKSGRKQWQLSENNHERAQWLDHYALVGQELRNPKTGQVVHKTPDFRTFIAARGKTIWLITNGLNRQLEVWRVPG